MKKFIKKEIKWLLAQISASKICESLMKRKSSLQSLLFMLLLVLTGCVDLRMTYGGMGGIAHYNPGDAHRNMSSGFTIEFNSTITFDRNLTISVDSVFAKLRINDTDTKAIVRDFARPAVQLLSDKYGITLPFPDPVPKENERKFIVSTEYSEWRLFQKNSLSRTLPFISFSTSNGHDDLIRVRAKVPNAEVAFNSYTPKKVLVSAKLLVEIQAKSQQDTQWQNVAISDNSLKEFKEQLRKDLRATYYNYIVERYGVEMK